MSYRDDLAALRYRAVVLADELAQRQRQRAELAAMIEELELRARAEAQPAEAEAAAARARRRRRRLLEGALASVGAGLAAAVLLLATRTPAVATCAEPPQHLELGASRPFIPGVTEPGPEGALPRSVAEAELRAGGWCGSR